jgi:arsenite methyltransferase
VLEDVDLAHPELADLYDELPLWSAPFGLRLLDLVPMRSGTTILDVGAGTGFLTVELAQRCGASSHVISVDPWSAAMARLRRKLAYLALDNVTLLEQDAAELPLGDGSVDLVVSNLGVNNFENAEAVLRTCARVMKADARLFLSTNPIGHMAELYEVYADTLREAGRSDLLPALDAHVLGRGTLDSLAQRLDAAGLEAVRTWSDSFRMRFTDGRALLRHYFVRLAFVPGWKAIVEPAARTAVLALLERKLDARAAALGELVLSVPLACVEARKR